MGETWRKWCGPTGQGENASYEMRGRVDDGEKHVALIDKQVKLLAEKDRKGHAIT